MHWADRALDYALELGDQRVVAYTFMRTAMIATESGKPALVRYACSPAATAASIRPEGRRSAFRPRNSRAVRSHSPPARWGL